MSEGNGSGRLDRVEAILAELAAAQKRDHEELMSFGREANVRMAQIELSLKSAARTLDMLTEFRYYDRKDTAEREERMRKEAAERERRLDARIEQLVSAIGDLIRRIPPENLR